MDGVAILGQYGRTLGQWLHRVGDHVGGNGSGGNGGLGQSIPRTPGRTDQSEFVGQNAGADRGTYFGSRLWVGVGSELLESGKLVGRSYCKFVVRDHGLGQIRQIRVIW